MNTKFIQRLIVPAQTKIVMLILDGLGGLPQSPGGKTELETARTPNLDRLASLSSLGLTVPAGPGITVGSGPGHLAIFGYDPIEYEIGRGALEALGIGFEPGPDDIAARGNFCTVDTEGFVIDRRAGRITTDNSKELVNLLATIKIEGVEIIVKPIKEHRFALILRAPGLGDALTDSDPLKSGFRPLKVKAEDQKSEHTAEFCNQFIHQASLLLKDFYPANMIMLRGFAKFPEIPSYQDLYGLNPAVIALNGMYRGVAKLVGMHVLEVNGLTIEDEFSTLEKNWKDYDFFYLHVKKTDTFGENGDYEGKVAAIEEVDHQIPRLLNLDPDVVIVAGDHSSPAVLKSHSWHPVPVLVYSKFVRPDGITEFGERSCLHGSLGTLPAMNVMPIALANARRLTKYGA